MEPTYYIIITNTLTNISGFVKDFRAGLLSTQRDNYRLRVLQKNEADNLLAKLEKYYKKEPHLKFKLKRVEYKGDSGRPVICEPFPKAKRKGKQKSRKDGKPWILPRRDRQVIINEIERKKEERRKEQLKADARRQASLDIKPVNLNTSSFDYSKVDCRNCGICRDCLERQSKL